MEIKNAYRVYDLDSAFHILEEYGGDSMILAGGTDLMVEIREEKNRGSIILDITGIKELGGIYITDDKIIIGALTTFTDITENDFIKEGFHGLWKAAKMIGSPQIRNMGTLGGNICNGAAAADIVPPLLALDAELHLDSKEGKRTVKIKDFYNERNGETSLRENELLHSISFSRSNREGAYITFSKLGYRNALAISKISCAVYIQIKNNGVDDIRVASGALGRYPQREYELEEFMLGKAINYNLIKEASEYFSKVVEKRLKGRSSCEYKKEAVKGIFKQAMNIEKKALGKKVELSC